MSGIPAAKLWAEARAGIPSEPEMASTLQVQLEGAMPQALAGASARPSPCPTERTSDVRILGNLLPSSKVSRKRKRGEAEEDDV